MVENPWRTFGAIVYSPPRVRSRQVVLPKGRWYGFWDDAVMEGPEQVSLEAPLERIPLLVKAGSILPME